MYLLLGMSFEWDHEKSKTNMEKHGVSFEDAPSVFSGFHMVREDTRKNYGEKRFLALGVLGEQKRVVVIAHTHRKGKVRIISMRRANQREQMIFHHYHDNHIKGEN